MKKIVFLLSLVFIFSNCQKDPTSDPCYGINCYNGGYCVNGSCECPTGYSGNDCSTQLTPVSMTINRVKITSFPSTQSSGAGWDLFDGPDPFLTINYGTSSNQSSYVSGHFQNKLSAPITFTYGLPINITSLSSYLSVAIWDYDTTGSDFMSGIYFRPIDYTNGFPSVITLTTSTISMQLTVSWNF